MKRYLLALGIVVATPFAASALELKTSATKSLFACEGSALHRVALREAPARCCEGRIRCAQLLSTQGMIPQGMIPMQRRSRT
jgi:hypothetical protein